MKKHGPVQAITEMLPQMGVTSTLVPPDGLAAVKAAIWPETRMVCVETVGNPTLVVADIEELAKIAHDRGILLVGDNTFTPMIISPARLGADVLIYSMTKSINGASDLIACCISCSRDFGHSLCERRACLSGVGGKMTNPSSNPPAAIHVRCVSSIARDGRFRPRDKNKKRKHRHENQIHTHPRHRAVLHRRFRSRTNHRHRPLRQTTRHLRQ